jgi:hypothetical protein
MEVSGQLYAPAVLPQEKSPWYPLDMGWVVPRAVLNAVVKRKIPSPRRESKPKIPIVQLVAQRYTDRPITALTSFTVILELDTYITYVVEKVSFNRRRNNSHLIERRPCFVHGSSWIRIWAWRSANLSEDFNPPSKCCDITLNRPRPFFPLPFQFNIHTMYYQSMVRNIYIYICVCVCVCVCP